MTFPLRACMSNAFKKIIKSTLSSWLYALYCQKAKPLPDSTLNGTLLVVAPHPDDESFACGALIARHVAAGHPVHILVVTDGSGSSQAEVIDTKELVKLRQSEVLAAATKLGVPTEAVTFWNYKDGHSKERSTTLEYDLKQYYINLNPAWIAAPFIIDAHPDHVAVAKAVEQINPIAPVFSYPLWFWPQKATGMLFNSHGYKAYKLDARPHLQIKEDAIRCHRSQFENITNAEEWGYLDPHIINMQLRPYELFFTLQDLSKSP